MNKSECWANPEWCARNWGNRRGKPWTEEEYNKALTMRLFKKTDAEIALELGRTQRSVEGKLGYWRP